MGRESLGTDGTLKQEGNAAKSGAARYYGSVDIIDGGME
jgi:hypothetical protein